jgi:hypothetical protein
MEKESLAHWNFAIDFTAMEAAALALGLDPRNVDGQPPAKTIIRPVYERMRDDFEQAVIQMEVAPIEVAEKGFLPGCLVSIRLERIYGVDDIMMILEGVALKRPQSRFEQQRFSRGAIHRWLNEIDMPSVYAFVPFVRETIKTFTEWPWGTHHTEALGHLGAAAMRWWTLYDPSEPDTAPTNKQVAEWLQTERGLSQKMAEAMASILRADGLPTGPRK